MFNDSFYYGGTPNPPRSLEATFVTANIEQDLKQYYSGPGGKSPLYDLYGHPLETDRLKHMLSAYLFGILIYRYNCLGVAAAINASIQAAEKQISLVCKDYKREREDHRRTRSDLAYRDFLYIWYLTCLFHDVGYSEEKKRIARKPLLTTACIKSLLPRNALDSWAPKVLIDTSADYYCLRALHAEEYRDNNRFDHGILAGVLMYDWASGKAHDLGDCQKEPTGLWFGELIVEKYFVPASWAIICHNIWLAYPRDKRQALQRDSYRRHGCGDLITRDPFISIEDHPLLFLLCLVDYLEPIKKCDFSTNALRCAKFEFDRDSLSVQFPQFTANKFKDKQDGIWFLPVKPNGRPAGKVVLTRV